MKSPIQVLILLFVSALLFQGCVTAKTDTDSFTIYMVRHAEKAVSTESPKDPPLTNCGTERAIHLANYLKKANLEVIYSTDYDRTKSTANPTAQAHNLEVESYNPRDLEAFAQYLLQQKQDVLVAGHSNTTPELAALVSGQEVDKMDDGTYDLIFKFEVKGDKKTLTIIESDFVCQ